MDVAESLARLREDSPQVAAAVVFDREAKVVGATLEDERAARLVRGALELLGAAERRAPADEGAAFQQLEVALPEGSVFVVRDEERLIAATTPPEPTVGLVFYDLKSCLRRLGESAEKKPKAKSRAKAPAKPAERAKPKPRAAAKKPAGGKERKKRADS